MKNHSALDVILYEWIDNNADDIRDGWSNINDYHLHFFILRKDCTEWEIANNINNGQYKSSYWREQGLFALLFSLETDKVRKKNRKTM